MTKRGKKSAGSGGVVVKRYTRDEWAAVQPWAMQLQFAAEDGRFDDPSRVDAVIAEIVAGPNDDQVLDDFCRSQRSGKSNRGGR